MGPELIIAGWFAGPVIGKLITTAMAYMEGQPSWQTGMKDKLTRLQDAHPKICAVVSAVELGSLKECNQYLETWLWKLRDAVDKAEDVLDELEYLKMEKNVRARKSKVSVAGSNLKNIARRAIKHDPTLKRLKKVLKVLDDAAADVGLFFQLVGSRQQRHLEISSDGITSALVSTESGEVIGREKEKKEVIERLLMPRPEWMKSNVAIVPIIGMGGVGKTTLAQLVYSDDIVKEHFNLRMWVCVSRVFDVSILTRKLLESATGEAPRVASFEMLQEKLMEVLKHKEFLLVLDDVWNDDDLSSWEKLFAPLQHAHKKSKIVVTTRLETVAAMMTGTMDAVSLNGLADDDCWLLLRERAFGKENPDNYPRLKSIGRQIANKLKGSPLAAKTLGGLLRTNLDDEHWKHILGSEIFKLKQGENDIMPVLRLSYQYLPPQLQSCFAYCSIFPQDHQFNRGDLVQMWMASGLLQHPTKERETLEEVGDECFRGLVKGSFFELDRDSERFYSMHDLLHDLASLVSAGECLRFVGGGTGTNIPNSVRHLSLATSDPDVLENVCKLEYLRTLDLFLTGDDSDQICHALGKKLKSLKSLHVLKISAKGNIELPGSISSLLHLRYLNLMGIYSIRWPRSICRLYHLQVLSLPDNARSRPTEGLSNLTNLRHLIITRTELGRISCIGKLIKLQQLVIFDAQRTKGHGIGELKDMRELRSLGIGSLENVVSYEEACEAKLKEKERLMMLRLEWASGSVVTGSPELDELVLDGLEPHPYLKDLQIEWYRGTRSALWMENQSSLSNLGSVSLTNCHRWECLPSLMQLPYLEVLYLQYMNATIQVFSLGLVRTQYIKAFPSLKELWIEGIPEWKEWSEGEDNCQWFPRLEKLWIKGCPKLSRLPHLPPGLRQLEINRVGLQALPGWWQGSDGTMMSQSSPLLSLSSLTITYCKNLKSLAKGLLEQPQQLKALRELKVWQCKELVRLPRGEFVELSFLEHLSLIGCPKLQTPTRHGLFLPPSLVRFQINNCGNLDSCLPESLLHLTSPSRLSLVNCTHIASLPLAKLPRGLGGALQWLDIQDCKELVSLGSLDSNISIQNLLITGCPKLVSASSPRTSTGSCEGFSLSLDSLTIDDPTLLYVSPVLKATVSLRVLKIKNCSLLTSIPDQMESWLSKNCRSLQLLHLGKAISLETLPLDLKRLSSLQKLELQEAHQLQSLPDLPVSLKSLHITSCHPVLADRCCKGTGADWSKIAHIPIVDIRKMQSL